MQHLGLKEKSTLHKDWKLNERHFGELSGKRPDCENLIERFSKEKVDQWLSDPEVTEIPKADDWLRPQNYAKF